MVELINALRTKVFSLLKERDEHPGLQKILDIVEMLLGLPSSTSVAQVNYKISFIFIGVMLLH